MNLKEVLSNFKEELNGVYEESEVIFIFYMVVEHIMGWKRSVTHTRFDHDIPQDQLRVFQHMLQLLKQHVPLQYVIGQADFYQLKFKVDPSVLIPRPETEELVDWIIDVVRQHPPTGSAISILDIGTGSGCIAIALQKNLPESMVSALDISEKALEIALYNSIANHAPINFVHADIRTFSNNEQFDIIVSNPPYITNSEKAEMHQHVLEHEPHLALFVKDENALEFYDAIANYAYTALKPGGLLFFEINGMYGVETVEILKAKQFINITLKKDMQGVDRMICCKID
ncbi:release factor glutamine methyltransferase [Pedobacter sp. UYP24]